MKTSTVIVRKIRGRGTDILNRSVEGTLRGFYFLYRVIRTVLSLQKNIKKKRKKNRILIWKKRFGLITDVNIKRYLDVKYAARQIKRTATFLQLLNLYGKYCSPIKILLPY